MKREKKRLSVTFSFLNLAQAHSNKKAERAILKNKRIKIADEMADTCATY